NTFGDVIVHGLKGALTIDTRFCDVELADLSGVVRVRMKGLESKLDAKDLHSGGVFILRSIDATFAGVAGQLNVDNYLGGVTLRPGPLPSKLGVACESGPIHLYVDPGAKPNLVALANAGAVHSDVALVSETWGNTTIARNKSADAPQQIDLLTSFADINVHQQAPAAPAGQQPGPNGTMVTETKV